MIAPEEIRKRLVDALPGAEVTVRDMNAEVFDWLNHADRLTGYFDFVLDKVRELESQPTLDEKSFNIYRFLAPLAPRHHVTPAKHTYYKSPLFCLTSRRRD